MTRRTPPSPIHLLPAHIPTPPRGTPKYSLPTPPRRIPLVDTVGPKLRIHAYTTSYSSERGIGADPARMGLTNIIVPCPDHSTSGGGGGKRERSESLTSEIGGEMRVGKKIQPPWLRSRGLDEAGAVRMAMGEIRLVPPKEARVRGTS